MIKRRVTSEQDFINQTDLTQEKTKSQQEPKSQKEGRKNRKFTSHTLQMNEEEYQLLKELAEKYCQSHSGVIRFALKALAEKK